MKEVTVKTIIRSASHPTERIRVRTINEEPTMTQQQFKEEADINNIMRKYGADPVAFNALTRKGGIYADFSNIKDYHGMLQEVEDAKAAFAALPAQMRSRFNNDPGQLIEFLQDSKNYDEGVELGLFEPKKQNSQSTGATSKNELNDKTEATEKTKTTK